jgi:uncharacterized repeat protein (TIGR01451 family)
MKSFTPTSRFRNSRAFIASFLTCIMLVTPLMPVGYAATIQTIQSKSRSTAKQQPARKETAPATQTARAQQELPITQNLVASDISATKVDTILNDALGDGKAQAGDTIKYDITITNNGTTDALNVALNDTIDANTTLVGNSIHAQPQARNDAYTTVGNTLLEVGVSAGAAPAVRVAGNVFANDANPTDPSSFVSNTQPANGTVTFNSDGTFTYLPNAGFTGPTDTFTYTVRNDADNTLTDTATVTITISGRAWYVNNAGANGDGRSTSPFNSLAPVNGAGGAGDSDAINDVIYLFQGSGAYTTGITLENGQQLIGNGVDLVISTFTLRTGSLAERPTMTNGTGHIITLAQNNTVRGLNTGDTTNIDIIGNAFGTFTADNIAIGGTGRPLSLTTGTLAATFDSITSTSSPGGQGILIQTNVAGNMVVTNGTTITNPATQGILVTGNTASINFGNTSVTGGTDGISLSNNSGGTRTFGTITRSGGTGVGFLHAVGGGSTSITGATSISGTGGRGIDIEDSTTAVTFSNVTVGTTGGTGVFLEDNSGAITFADFDVTPNANQKAVTINNSTGTVTATSGDLSANGNSVLEITGPAGRTPLAMSLTSLASTNNANVGGLGLNINLTSGTFTVTGATNIQNPAGIGIQIQNSTTNFSFQGATTSNGSGGTAIFLNANSGSFTFPASGTFSITPDSGQRGLHATANTGNITSGTGTISTTNNVAVEIVGVSAGSKTPLNIQLTSVTALASGGNPANGIVLTNTSSTGSPGGFRVLGTGGTCTVATPTCTGGYLQSPTNDGVALNGAANVFLTRMRITDAGRHGVSGTGSSSTFSFDNGLIIGAGDGNDEDALFFGTPSTTNLTGTLTLSNSVLSGFTERGLHVKNTTGALTINASNNSYLDNDDTFGANAILVESFGTAGIVLNVTNSLFDNVELNSIQYEGEGTGTNDVNIIGNSFTAGGGPDNNPFGGGIELIVDLGSTMTFDIQGNFFNDIPDDAILIVGEGNAMGRIGGDLAAPAGAPGAGDHSNKGNRIQHGPGFNGFAGDGIRLDDDGTFNAGVQPTTTWTILIKNNVLDLSPAVAGTSGGSVGDQGIVIFNRDHPGTLNATVENNTVTDTLNEGLRVFSADRDTVVTPGPNTFVRVANNNFSNIGGVNAISMSVDDQSTMCANVTANSGNGPGSSPEGAIFMERRTSTSQFNVPQASEAAISAANNGAPVNSIASAFPLTFNQACTPALPTNSLAPENTFEIATSEGDTQNNAAATTNRAVPVESNLTNPNAPVFIGAPVIAAQPAANQASANAQRGQDASKEAAQKSKTANAGGGGEVQPFANAFPITIPVLQPGESVTITFQVKVIDVLPQPASQISNQGQITSSSFAGTVLTDDPSIAGTNNPTVTPILGLPNIAINNASVAEPTSGSAPMPFTVTLTHIYGAPVSVSFSTADGTATAAGGDYTSTSGTITFNPGQTVQTISVPVLANGDTTDENFTVTLNTPVNGYLGMTPTATGTITEANPPGRVLISELRTSGPGGAGDDFIELYNNQDVSQNISGWAIVKSGASCLDSPVIVAVIPANTTIPARGHYLVVGPQYSLTASVPGNATVAAVTDIEADRNIGLFNTSNLSNFSTATREDAVGFDVNAGGSFNCDLLREGATLLSASGSASQYSFARILTTGLPKETNDSAADFQLVTTTPAVAVGNNLTPALGAPGPENLAAPIQRNGSIKPSLVDGTVAATAPPNRVRSGIIEPGVPNAFGTLSIQRKFTNTLGVPVTRLRFRVVDLTTINNRPAGSADLRVLSSTGVVRNSAGTVVRTVNGLTLEAPPQPNGGGLNSALTVVLPGGMLAPGSSIEVQFLLGVQEQGNFSFFVNVEALPGPAGSAAPLGGANLKNGTTKKSDGAEEAATEPKQQEQQ